MAKMLLDYYCVFIVLFWETKIRPCLETFPNCQPVVWAIVTCVLKAK